MNKKVEIEHEKNIVMTFDKIYAAQFMGEDDDLETPDEDAENDEDKDEEESEDEDIEEEEDLDEEPKE